MIRALSSGLFLALSRRTLLPHVFRPDELSALFTFDTPRLSLAILNMVNRTSNIAGHMAPAQFRVFSHPHALLSQKATGEVSTRRPKGGSTLPTNRLDCTADTSSTQQTQLGRNVITIPHLRSSRNCSYHVKSREIPLSLDPSYSSGRRDKGALVP